MSAAKTVAPWGIKATTRKPTEQHRIAIIPVMLGTVEAVSPEGEVRYFDYDWEAAAKFAGITEDSDPRLAKVDPFYSHHVGTGRDAKPVTTSARVLWVRD